VRTELVYLPGRFPLGLRMVEELLAARGIIVSHETVRQSALKFGQPFANQIRRRLPPTRALKSRRNRWFVDSPLEGGGFELPVPRGSVTRVARR
jgi:transposase-like protein